MMGEEAPLLHFDFTYPNLKVGLILRETPIKFRLTNTHLFVKVPLDQETAKGPFRSSS